MEASSSKTASLLGNETVRRWISRGFIVSILVYLVVLGYLIFESVTGASRWAPYGVNMPLFIALILASEAVMVVTAVQIFRQDSGIWPPAIKEGWEAFRDGARMKGALQMLGAAWDISLIDLRLRTGTAIAMGRINRLASIAPLVYALVASAGGAPWGLRGSAIFDIAISLAVWAFMEIVMVEPAQRETVEATPALAVAVGATGASTNGATPAASTNGATPAVSSNGASIDSVTRAVKESRYSVRPAQLSDLDRLEELEIRNWKDQAASRDVIAGRINTYPEGQVAAVHTTVVGGKPVKSKVAAWCSTMAASEDHVGAFATWDDLTSNGTLSAYNPDGDVIVGVNLTSVTQGGTYILLAEILAAVVEGGKTKMIGGSRLTGFTSFNERRQAESKQPLSAGAYARLKEIRGFRINEDRLDKGDAPLSENEYRALANQMRSDSGKAPLGEDDVPDYVCSNVRGYMSIPGARLVRVVADYFRDPASADYGVVIEWPNPIPRPLRQIPFIKRFVAERIREEIAAEWEQRKQHLRDIAARRARRQVPEYLRRNDIAETPAPAQNAATNVVTPGESAEREKAPPRTRMGT